MIHQPNRRSRRRAVDRLRQLFFGSNRPAGDRRANQPIHVETLEARLMLASELGLDPSGSSTAWVSEGGQASALSSAWVDSPAEGEDVPAQDLVAFAKALAQTTGVKMYSAAWCPACNAQKALFEDGADFLPFIEVTNPDRTLNAIGIAANVTSFPTWEFPDGTRAVGSLSLATIAQRAGVAIPTGVNPFVAPINDTTLYGGSPLHLALNGYDPNGGTLTYSVVSSNPSLVQASVLTGNRSAKITVSGWGEMIYQLFESQVPDATGRFITLAQSGFYNAASNTTPITAHRVIDNFVFQFGDPTGTGAGGSTLGTFNDDFHPDLQHNLPGALSWAKSSDDTNNSQVFVTDVPTRYLDFNHSYFGQLTEGDKVRNAITGTATDSSNRPKVAINIESVTIFNDVENGLLVLKAAEGASGEADITVTVTDASGNQFVETFHVTVAPDPYDGGPYLADIPTVRTTMNSPATFVLSAIDVEGDPVLFDGLKSGSVNYTFSVNSATGEVIVTPPANYIGTMQLLVRVKPVTASDTSDLYDTQIVSIAVGPAAPLAVDLVAASDSGYLNTDNITKTNELTFEVTGVTSGVQVRLYRGVTLLGQATASGTSVTIATSGLASLGDGTYNVTATQVVNSIESNVSPALNVTLDTTVPPIFTSTPPTTAGIGTPLTYNAQNAEEGATGAAYSLLNAPTGAVIDAGSGVLAWTPTAAQLGLHPFSVVITDAAGNSRSQNLSVQVTSDALMAFRLDVTDAGGTHLTSVDVGTDFLLKVFVQDLRLDAQGVFAAFLDVLYNQQLVTTNGAISFGSQFPNQPLQDLTTPGLINETGAVAGFTPLGSSEYLLFSVPMRAIHTGMAQFTADPADNPSNEALLFGGTAGLPLDDINFGSVTLTVNPAFNAVDDLFLVNEDSGSTSFDPRANDQLLSGSTGALLIAAVGATSHGGTVSIASDGKSVSYTPAANFFGDETFSYTISDGTGEDSATVTVRVAAGNDDPTAVPDSFTVSEDAVAVALDVLANDLITPDVGETLQISSFSGLSAGGTLSINAAKNRLLYTPADNFFGTETFTYVISDGNGGTSTATGTVTVVEANDPPLAQDDLFQVPEDSTNNVFNVLSNDSTQGDVGETLTITGVTTPEHGGTVTIATGGSSLVYAPAANYFGIERFQYTISDGNGGTAQASVVVTVQGVNDPPTGTADALSVVKDTTANVLDVLANDSSLPDATEVLTISAVGTPTAGGTVSISANGTRVQYTPLAGFTGTDTFTYTVQDPGGATAVATATVTVLNYIPSKLSGYAYIDVNNNGLKESTETPLGGVVMTLKGTDLTGATVNQQKTTDALGFYQFIDLAPGQYVMTQVQPKFLIDGIDSGGTLGISSGADALTINLPQDTDGQNLNFGERGRASQHITMFDFLASTPREAVLATTTSDGAAQWYAVEGGWAHAKSMQFQLQTNQSSAKLDVTTTEAQQYSTMLNFQTPQHIQRLGGAGVAQMLRIVAAPAILFPGADCGCGEGEATSIPVQGGSDAEGESGSEVVAAPLTASARASLPNRDVELLSSMNPVNSPDAEGQPPATILMAPTPADAYLATELLLGEDPSSVWNDRGIDQVLRDMQSDDERFADAVDAAFSGLLDENVL
ncbi:MAG: Ig-like domain-containing protein [Pirellulaceae bacterium]